MCVYENSFYSVVLVPLLFAFMQLTIALPAFDASVAMASMMLRLHLTMSDSIELIDSLASRIRLPIFIGNKIELLLMVMSAWSKCIHRNLANNRKCNHTMHISFKLWHLLPGNRLLWLQYRPPMGIQTLFYCIRLSFGRHLQCYRKPIGCCFGPIQ